MELMEAQPLSLNSLAPFAVRSQRALSPFPKWRQGLQQTSTGVTIASPLPMVSAPVDESAQENLLRAMFQANSAEVFILTYHGITTETLESRISSHAVTEIDQLKAGKEDEVVPTDYAYEQARRTVEAAYAAVKPLGAVPAVQPEPWATTDDVGGIRLLWEVGSKKLRANFAARPDLRTYLYHESAFEHDAEPLNVRTLTGRLTWLTER